MSKALAVTDEAGEILEKVINDGDLAKLSPSDRIGYYRKVCESVGLNPLTKPFEYILLNRKLTLYAKRDAADQLRQIHGVSIKVITTTLEDGLFTVHVAAQDKTGRHDEDIGTVHIAGLRGEAKANAMLKAMTKAKRRVTLSICGLGWLDETEVADIEGAARPTQNLDDLFPTAEAPAASQSDEDGDQAPVGVEAPDATGDPVTLTVNGEKYDLSNAAEYFDEYLKQLRLIESLNSTPPRERMTEMRVFEEANADSLDQIPPEGRAKLIEWRMKLNRKLGTTKEDWSVTI